MTPLRRTVLTSTAIAASLLLSAPLALATDTPAPGVETQSTQPASEECYCSVRKRQQVKARLEKKAGQEQPGQTDSDQSSQSTDTSSVSGSD